ncbi:unnamed protein product [Coffea canephora]|uniref:Uncharacterized protein n=1 Tax=Coffea canephora TaxID=49390 RepID=A0A068U4Y0_COFCA|nr:unnamed protein product [Coffea canephora]
MERWLPVFDIFLNSPCPETEASLWLQRSFDPSSTAPPISTSSFLQLLTNPSDVIVLNSSPSLQSPPPHTKRFMFIQMLPSFVQARILSFLVYDRKRFCKRDLIKFARSILGEDQELDFWVKKGAHQLLDLLSGSGFEWISNLNLDSEEDNAEDEFRAMPDWLKDAAKNRNSVLLPWLPILPDGVNLRKPFGNCEDDEDSENDAEKEKQEYGDDVMREDVVGGQEDVGMNPEVETRADFLKNQILKFETTSKTVEVTNEIRRLCVESRVDSLAILELIEPWKADDETASIMISQLLDGGEDELGWPSHVLCSIILPKMLSLTEPASRVLVSATIEYCKIHGRAAEYALLFPLILKVDGINNPMCDVLTRIVRECLHPAHAAAFFQKLLCEDAKNFICLPCHRCLIAGELVWTESLFYFMQNVLNHNVHLTQDAVEQLVQEVYKSTKRFPRSLKLGNFLLSFVNKFTPLLRPHKRSLMEAVEHTDTLVTKSLISKLASL